MRKGVTVHGHEFAGLRHGWKGVLDGDLMALGLEATAGILPRGGTILGTSRTNPYKGGADGTALVRAAMADHQLDAIIAIGGEDTLGVAGRLSADGVAVVGVPKTITMTSPGPTTRSASTPPSRSRATRSIGCIRRPSRTTA